MTKPTKIVFPILQNPSPTVDLTSYFREHPNAGQELLQEAVDACQAAGVEVVVEGAEPGQSAVDAIVKRLERFRPWHPSDRGNRPLGPFVQYPKVLVTELPTEVAPKNPDSEEQEATDDQA